MTRQVNICFHGIGTPYRELEPGEAEYWITIEEFYRILDEVMTWPLVRLSFDDGNSSDVDVGLPALRDRGLGATFFLLAGRLGVTGSVDHDGARELGRQGMSIGSHGMDHRSWRGMNNDLRDRELVESREVLSQTVGREVSSAAIPLGIYDRRLLGDLRGLGYRSVHTSDRRHARVGAWLQPRFSVRAHDTAASLRATVGARPSMVEYARLQAVGVVKRLR